MCPLLLVLYPKWIVRMMFLKINCIGIWENTKVTF